jgi:hypothetical protein
MKITIFTINTTIALRLPSYIYCLHCLLLYHNIKPKVKKFLKMMFLLLKMQLKYNMHIMF